MVERKRSLLDSQASALDLERLVILVLKQGQHGKTFGMDSTVRRALGTKRPQQTVTSISGSFIQNLSGVEVLQ